MNIDHSTRVTNSTTISTNPRPTTQVTMTESQESTIISEDTVSVAITDTLVTTIPTVSVDLKSLFLLFGQIENNPDTKKFVKNLMQEAKETIFKSGEFENELSVEIFSKMSKEELKDNLEYAVSHLKIDIIKLLLATGMLAKDDPSLGDVITHLPAASRDIADDKVCETLKLLIDYGFNYKYNDCREFRYNIANNRPKTVELFLDSGIDVNMTFDDGDTPLKTSLESKRYDVARLLLRRGASVKGLIFKDLPQDVQYMIDEQGPMILSTEAQKVKLLELHQEIKKALKDLKFERFEVAVLGVYHSLIQEFCVKFRGENTLFVAEFVPDTSKVIVTFASSVLQLNKAAECQP